jgi:hypothetical protein
LNAQGVRPQHGRENNKNGNRDTDQKAKYYFHGRF